MPLKLIKPRGRKASPYYYVRGSINGQRYEISSGTTNKADAEKFKAQLEYRLSQESLASENRSLCFSEAAERYIEWRRPAARDIEHLKLICRLIGTKQIRDIVTNDLVVAANLIKPRGSPQTKNRCVMRPAAAVLHYAAKNKWCDWLRIPLFKEPQPETRAVDVNTAARIVEAAPPGHKRALILWLFLQGDRISDILKIEWRKIRIDDPASAIVQHRVGKTDRWRTAPLAPEIAAELAPLRPADGSGWVFPWQTRFGVYKWLRPLCRSLNVHFTPHMGRHSVGTWLNQGGVGLRTIMDKLSHASAKSSLRYQSADIEIVRAASRKCLPQFSPRSTGGNCGELRESAEIPDSERRRKKAIKNAKNAGK